ncbi:MAG: hypothetical protein K6E62_11750 [Lachnospiraceae bacterium]|nr:hypothetical protein [Lachnospiraceae bacterium]
MYYYTRTVMRIRKRKAKRCGRPADSQKQLTPCRTASGRRKEKSMRKHLQLKSKRNNSIIGKDRLMSELFPICSFTESGSGQLYVKVNNEGFPANHREEFDRFLIKSGYKIENDYEEYMFTGKDVVPDYDAFACDIEEILTDITSVCVMHPADYIVTAVSNDLYDEQTKAEILIKKAHYLCESLSAVLDLEIADSKGFPEIRLHGIRNDIETDRYSNWAMMLLELGYYIPLSSLEPETESFIERIEDYINSKKYLEDEFKFGQHILRVIDNHFCKLDWFPHEDKE